MRPELDDDLDEALRRTAPASTGPLDVDGLLRRARRQRNRHRVAGAITAAVVVIASLGVVQQLRPAGVVLDADPAAPVPTAPDRSPPGTPVPSPAATPSLSGVTPLPAAPIEGRQGALAVWTGTEVIVWGGTLVAEVVTDADLAGEGRPEDGAAVPTGQVGFADGAAYDPDGRRWRAIAPAPVRGGHGDGAVWTGREVLVWSAADALLVAYDPVQDRWRTLPAPPGPASGRPAVALAWTGAEAVLWGGMERQPELPAHGVAFDVATERWRELPDAPTPPRQLPTATWTGAEVIVWGGDDLITPSDVPLGGAAYDPAADAWRLIAPAPGPDRWDASAAWTGAELLVWSASLAEGLGYDPTEDRWRVLAASPVPPSSVLGGVTTVDGMTVVGNPAPDPTVTWTGEELLVWGGRFYGGDGASDTATFDPATDTWRVLPPTPLSARCDAATTWMDDSLFVWGGQLNCHGGPAHDGAILRADDG